jgi:tripeptidyl-peptidase-1
MLCGVLLAAMAPVAGAGSGMVAMEPWSAGTEPALGGWSVAGPATRGEMLELTFAVRQSGTGALLDALMRTSRPASPEYGRHLSLEDVNALTAPDPAHLEAVASFIRRHGAEPRAATPNSDFVTAVVPVEVAEVMLSTRYVRLVHNRSGAEVSRAPSGYSLPEDVAAAVDFVAPTVHVPGARGVQTAMPAEASIGLNTPKNLRTLYSIGNTEGNATGNRQAVTAFLEQGFSTLGLKAFWKVHCGGITCGKGTVKMVGDAASPGLSGGVESMLDIETITGVAGNVESEFWGFSGRSPDNPQNEPFLKWLTTLSNTSDAEVPKIFSTSYGEDEGSWSKAAAERLNVEFQKAGARGISLLYASGDEGANCKQDKFVPEGPGSSPYVTAVGGTMPTSGYPAPGSEAAIGLSSGGFSNYWPMPDYQKTAVQKYLTMEGLPSRSRGYATSGRAYPDIAAQATNFIVYTPIPLPGVSGTSCASPTAAGVFALLNDLRLAQGKSTLGFLNPLIYEHASAFNDVTTGASAGCLTDGWPAKPGWDAVTGLGTPNFAKLAKAVEGLPSGRSPEIVV